MSEQPAPDYESPTPDFDEMSKLDFDEMSDSEKLEFLCEHMFWLTSQVSALLQAANSNPAFRLLTRKLR